MINKISGIFYLIVGILDIIWAIEKNIPWIFIPLGAVFFILGIFYIIIAKDDIE